METPSQTGQRGVPPSYNEAMRQKSSQNVNYGTVPASNVDHRPPGEFRFQQTSVLNLDLGEDPCQLTCPYCHEVVVTVVEQEIGCLAYGLSALLCLVGCWPCVCLPCCIADFLDITHICPNCNRLIHTHRRLNL